MKTLFLFILLFPAHFLQAQQSVTSKPKYVTIINDEIVSMDKVNEYGKQGYIKQIIKGVSEEERTKLSKKFGDKIGDKEFIVLVSLYTEKEKREKETASKLKITPKNTTIMDAGGPVSELNKEAKDFTVQMLDGSNVQLSGLKEKVVLVNFWATWCAPCLMEFYDITTKVLEPLKDKQFVFLPIPKVKARKM